MVVKGAIAIGLTLALGWSIQQNFQEWKGLQNADKKKYVRVEGNVKKPGYYRIEKNTNHYQMLRKAGLTDSSDISHIKLVQNANEDTTIRVGVTKEKIKRVEKSGFTNPTLAFFTGTVFIKEGLELRTAELGQRLVEGWEVTTGPDGQVKILLENQTELYLHSDGVLRLKQVENKQDSKETIIFLDAGELYVKIPVSTPESRMQVQTRTLHSSIGGASGLLKIQAENSYGLVHLKSGDVKVRPADGDEWVQLDNQRKAVIRSGDRVALAEEEEFQPEEIKRTFKKLDQNFAEYVESQQEVSFLVCGQPNFYILISMIPTSRKFIIMDIPANTYVGDFMDGIFELDQALAFGGMELSRELVQRLIGRPVKYTMSIGINDVLKIIDGIGGLQVPLDNISAANLNRPAGNQKLSGREVLEFLAPDLRGRAFAIEKQKTLLLSFFRQFKSKQVDVSPGMIMDSWRNINTNIPLEEAIGFFQALSGNERWNVISTTMPHAPYKHKLMNLVSPRYSLIRQLYN